MEMRNLLLNKKYLLKEDTKLVWGDKGTKLFKALHFCLSGDNGERRSKDFINIAHFEPEPSPASIMKNPSGPNGEKYFKNIIEGRASWWHVTNFGYQEYLKACEELNITPHKKPEYLETEEDEVQKTNKLLLSDALDFEEFDSGFADEDSANVFYYIGRLIENKGPQTDTAIEKYLLSKFEPNTIPNVVMPAHEFSWQQFLSTFFYKDGRKFSFTDDTHECWVKITEWRKKLDIEKDPYAAIVQVFWDWYKEKKAGNNIEPDEELIKFVNNAGDETIEKTFGKYYKFAMGLLAPYINKSNLSEEDKLIQKFWDWHRAKKAGKPYQLDQDTIDGLVVFLRKPKAVEVLQQYYYYFVRVIERMSDKTIKTPINTTGLQQELKRIMDNLDNDEYVDELERIERNRLHGGEMTAGPVFVLPVEVIKSIRTLAKDDDNIEPSKVGKIDKSQVKECYVYCNNELNKKFHIGKTGIFDLNIQDFYDTYKIVFQRGFNTRTLHKIFDEVCQYLLDQLDKGTAEYWKKRGTIDIDDVEDFNEAYRILTRAGYTLIKE